jgi:hypothetical protein
MILPANTQELQKEVLRRLVLRNEAQHKIPVKHLLLGFMLQPNLQQAFCDTLTWQAGNVYS